MHIKRIAPCLFAVLVDILGFGLAFPVLTGLFTTGSFLPSNTPVTTRYQLLAIGFALYPFFMFFGSSFMGDLSDILGRRKVLMLCMGGFFLGYIGMAFGVESKSLAILFTGRALTGITAASLPTTMAAIADISTPETKAKNMSYVVLIQCIGFVLGPLMGGLLSSPKEVAKFGLSLPFYGASILSLLAFLSIAIFFKESFTSPNKKFHLLRIFYVFKEAAVHPRMKLLTTAFIFHQIGIGLFIQLILIYFQKIYAYTTFEMGLFNSYLGLLFAIGILIFPRFTKKYAVERITAFSLCVVGVGNIILTFLSTEWLLWLFSIPFGFFSIIAWSAILTSFSHAVSAESQGWALGITGAVVALAFMITGFSPNLIPYFGVMPLIFISGLCLLLSSFIMSFYNRKYIR